MDRRTNAPRSRVVVCHSNQLVGEDLRQLLLSEGAADVVVVQTLEGLTPGSDAIAFVEGSASNLAQDAKVQVWLAVGTPVVCINGGVRDASLPDGLSVLEQPFRSDDVLDLLKNLRVF